MKKDQRSRVVNLRLTPAERATLERMGRDLGKQYSELIRDALFVELVQYSNRLSRGTAEINRETAETLERLGKVDTGVNSEAPAFDINSWIGEQPEDMRDPQGNLMPTEEEGRVAILENHGPGWLLDISKRKWGLHDWRDVVIVTRHLDRKQFVETLLSDNPFGVDGSGGGR
jgi:hypothetical protein